MIRRDRALTVIAGMLAVLSLGLMLYPSAAQWLSSYNQSLVTGGYADAVDHATPDAEVQLKNAELYNSRLSSGAEFVPMANVGSGVGESTEREDTYLKQLTTRNGVMSRVQIAKIGVDLPMYHGTSDETLLRGAGHLQGTSLPVGGESTHAVITAHRGLAESRMFTDLDKIVVGDRIVVTTFGRVMTYQVIETKVVDPEQTASLRQQEGKDLITLVTCTPIGINSQRIFVTAERITPTPVEDIEMATATVGVSFPWWLLAVALGVTLVTLYVVSRLRDRSKRKAPRKGLARHRA